MRHRAWTTLHITFTCCNSQDVHASPSQTSTVSLQDSQLFAPKSPPNRAAQRSLRRPPLPRPGHAPVVRCWLMPMCLHLSLHCSGRRPSSWPMTFHLRPCSSTSCSSRRSSSSVKWPLSRWASQVGYCG